MNELFAKFVADNSPKYNPDVVNGLACIYVPKALEWLDGVFKSASKSFPAGLVYEGCERCTPYEEYYEATKLKHNKRIFDLADSDLYLIKIKFSFTDENGVKEQIPDRFLYLPFVNEAGTFKISGTLYHVTGVLSDRVISPGSNNIFVRLIRDRLKFHHTPHSLIIDGKRQTLNVVWSSIYRKNQKDTTVGVTTRAWSSVAHYLFAKYGFTETFKRYAGFIPKVVNYDQNYVQAPGTILCRSSYLNTRNHPATFIQNHYSPSPICLEIPKDKWNKMTLALVAGFYYVVDHFPDRISSDRLDSTFLWSVLLGHVIFSGVYGEPRLYERITDHFSSLDDYLDTLVVDKLKEIGWEPENFYDLIARIMSDFPELLLGEQIDVNSMFNKNIEILYYMLFDIAARIFKVIYFLRRPKNKKVLTSNHIKEAFNRKLTSRIIFRVTRNVMVVETVTYCGDHKYPKLTSKLSEQEAGPSSPGGKKAKRVQITANNHLHESMIIGGNVLFLSKANPMPSTKINPYANVDLNTCTIYPLPEDIPVLARLRDKLSSTNKTHDVEVPDEVIDTGIVDEVDVSEVLVSEDEEDILAEDDDEAED